MAAELHELVSDWKPQQQRYRITLRLETMVTVLQEQPSKRKPWQFSYRNIFQVENNDNHFTGTTQR